MKRNITPVLLTLCVSVWAIPPAGAGPPLHLTNGGMTDTPEMNPEVASDGNGTFIVVWQEMGKLGDDVDLFFKRSTDKGLTWSEPSPLNTNAAEDSGSDFGPSLATDGKGRWIAAWISTDSLGGKIGTDTDPVIAISTDNGATWSAPFAPDANAHLYDTKGGDFAVQIAYQSDTWMLVHEGFSNFGIDADPIAFRSRDGGKTWPKLVLPKTTYATDVASDTSPRLVPVGEGTWLALWTSDDTLNDRIGDLDILFSTTDDDGDTWSPPTRIDSDTSRDDADDRFVSALTDGKGFVFTVWESVEGSAARLKTATSADAGKTWTSGPILNTETAQARTARLPVAGWVDGVIVVVWESWFPEKQGCQVTISRSGDRGETWTKPGDIGTGGGFNLNPTIAASGRDWLVIMETYLHDPAARYLVFGLSPFPFDKLTEDIPIFH